MTTMLRPVVAFCFFSLATLTLGGCASDTVATYPIQPTTHTLKAGDSFTFRESTFDESGVLVEGSDSSVIMRTIAVGGSYGGRDSVTTLASAADTIRLQQLPGEGFASYQESITIAPGIVFPGVWVNHRLTDSARTITVIDSTIAGSLSGADANVRMTITSGYLRDSVITVNGVVAHTHLYTKVITIKVMIPRYSFVSNTTVSVTYAYAPVFGFHAYLQTVNNSDSPQSPIPNGKTISTLTHVSE
jgi:hypothetical protein